MLSPVRKREMRVHATLSPSFSDLFIGQIERKKDREKVCVKERGRERKKEGKRQ